MEEEKLINNNIDSSPKEAKDNSNSNIVESMNEGAQQEEKVEGEPVSFKVVCNKKKYDIEFPLEGTVKQLKSHLSPIIDILPSMQKVMIKGLAKDEKTLKDLAVVKGAKIMVIGSSLNDVVNVNTPATSTETKSETTHLAGNDSFSKQHKKVIEKGVPEDAIPGIKDCKDPLPSVPLSGMLNKKGGKVRLTFKLESDQIWIGTKERTEKIPMNNISSVVSEAIEGHEEYHIMALQLGPTDASRYWIYWVPAQYVDAIKNTILGKW